MFCARLFICASWSPAGKGLTSWLSFVVSSVSLSLSHWYPGSGVVLDCIDSWSLQPYLLCLTSGCQSQIFFPCSVAHSTMHVEIQTILSGGPFFSKQHILQKAYRPPSRSYWTQWVQLLLEGCPYQISKENHNNLWFSSGDGPPVPTLDLPMLLTFIGPYTVGSSTMVIFVWYSILNYFHSSLVLILIASTSGALNYYHKLKLHLSQTYFMVGKAFKLLKFGFKRNYNYIYSKYWMLICLVTRLYQDKNQL